MNNSGLKRKLSFLLIAVLVLTMNVQVVHATTTEPGGDDPKTVNELQTTGEQPGDSNQDTNTGNVEDGNKENDQTTGPGTDTDDKSENGTTDTPSVPEKLTSEPDQDEDHKEAEKHQHTIQIYGVGEGHTYEAYQIFSGRVDIDGETKILANIKWGSGVKQGENEIAALMEDLKNCSGAGITGTPFAACETAEEVAQELEKSQNDSALLVAFSRIVEKHLSNTYKESDPNPKKQNDGTYVYQIPVEGDGYYFVKDKDESLKEDGEGESYTKYILQVISNVTVKAKADTPTIDKEIVECKGHEPNEPHTAECTGVKSNNAAVGDTVNFKLTSKVPAMDGYTTYWFNVEDTLSKGLDFKDNVQIVISGGALTEPITLEEVEKDSTKTDKAFTVTTQPAVDANGNVISGTSIKIVFKNFIQYRDVYNATGATIEISYSATLNKYAEMGNTGNKNEVKLIYSNDPQYPSGGGDEPGPNDPKGETPKSETTTYVTTIDLTKVTGEGADRKYLTGAQFAITGTTINIVLVRKDVFVTDPDGTYYQLNDGSYTTDAPTEQTAASYAGITGGDLSTATKYRKDTVEETTETPSEFHAVGTVGEDGVLRFEGLAAGYYEITELKAPNGYNKLEDSIKIEISWSGESTEEMWTVTNKGNAGGVKVDQDGHVTLDVLNNKGTTLPSTGGMGTTIFYAVGSILVIGAAIILIAKKRTSAEK